MENKDKVIKLARDRVKFLKQLEKLEKRQENAKTESSFERIGDAMDEINMILWEIDQNFEMLIKKIR